LAQEKANKGDASSAANIDQETQEGNLTSGHELSQNKMATGSRDNADPLSGSGAKARRYLDNQWESETSNSQNQYMFGKS
jgi:hypothetical protein